MPAIIRGKAQAFLATDISNLRQIALAADLYKEQYDRMPLRLLDLVKSGILSKSVANSPSDSTTIGFANEMTLIAIRPRERAENLSTPFKNSYIGFGDLGLSNADFATLIERFESPGAFVALSSDAFQTRRGTEFKGNYRRLLLDGSVQRKSHRQMVAIIDGRRTSGSTLLALFADHPDPWLNRLIFGGR